MYLQYIDYVWQKNVIAFYNFLNIKKLYLIHTAIWIDRCTLVLSYQASRPNHTSHRKFCFYEFVANVLCDHMGMIIFDLRGCGGCYSPKNIISQRAPWHFNSIFGSSYSASSAYQIFKKWDQLWLSASIRN